MEAVIRGLRQDLGRILVVILAGAGLAGITSTAQAAAPATPTVGVNIQPLTPYTSGGCWNPAYQCYRVFGVTDPGVKVTITVTSTASPGLSVTQSTFSTETADLWAGTPAGYFAASPNVTNLGAHGTDPSSLTFTAVARDGLGNASAPGVATVEKKAATPGDVTGPQLTNTRSPPGQWCATGLTCLGFCLITPSGCTGSASIEGSVEDNWADAFGVASEIADVAIVVTAADGSVVKEYHSFTRRGTQAYYGASLAHREFQLLQTYSWSVVATDAWGHTSNTASGSFTIMPG